MSQRDYHICTAAARGTPYTAIAAYYDITATRVKQIVAANAAQLGVQVRRGRKPGAATLALAAQVPVPAWVPDTLREEYRLNAARNGEEAAAAWARRAKRRIAA